MNGGLTGVNGARARGDRADSQIVYHEGVTKARPAVFISYSQDTRQWAEQLSESLRAKGLATWTDFECILPGQRWREEIQRALDRAEIFILLVGPDGAVGEWQEREWQGALERTWTDARARILPVLVNGSAPPSFLRHWQALQVQPDEAESPWTEAIYRALRAATSKGAESLPKPNSKPSKEFRSRLADMEVTARQLKSNQER
jgi:hypothetical protein